ncbi:MAG: hypothetical protein NVS1B4_25100 [Gemmatimonadaceae bacterium]
MRSSLSLVALLFAGCSHVQSRPDPFALRDIITQEELNRAKGGSAYDVIARTRPHYLRDRGATSLLAQSQPSATVFLNDQHLGPLETLRNVPVDHLREIRFFPGTTASALFGSTYHGGVIQLLSRIE